MYDYNFWCQHTVCLPWTNNIFFKPPWNLLEGPKRTHLSATIPTRQHLSSTDQKLRSYWSSTWPKSRCSRPNIGNFWDNIFLCSLESFLAQPFSGTALVANRALEKSERLGGLSEAWEIKSLKSQMPFPRTTPLFCTLGQEFDHNFLVLEREMTPLIHTDGVFLWRW